jgi:hypothetical protein
LFGSVSSSVCIRKRHASRCKHNISRFHGFNNGLRRVVSMTFSRFHNHNGCFAPIDATAQAKASAILSIFVSVMTKTISSGSVFMQVSTAIHAPFNMGMVSNKQGISLTKFLGAKRPW